MGERHAKIVRADGFQDRGPLRRFNGFDQFDDAFHLFGQWKELADDLITRFADEQPAHADRPERQQREQHDGHQAAGETKAAEEAKSAEHVRPP